MSAVSFPVTRPHGRALVVGSPAFRQEPLRLLRQQGFVCAESEDPYAAMIELFRHRLSYRALIICLAGFYREELSFISTVKRRMPHIEIWLTQTDGRVSALAEAINLGADGVLAEDGTLHRLATAPVATQPLPPAGAAGATGARPARGANGGTELLSEEPTETSGDSPSSLTGGAAQGSKMESSFGSVEQTANNPDESPIGEPVLSAEELRALLQDQPSMPPSGQERTDA